MRKLILYTLLLLNFELAYSAWQLPISNYPIETTEAGRQSWKIAEGANGWIYFANNNGLLEFNGVEWNIHKIENGAIIRAVATTNDGNIYVGALGEFGRFSPDRSGRLTYTNLSSTLEEQDLNHQREIWSIHATTSAIYFRTRREVLTLDNQQNSIKIKQGEGLALASCKMNNNIYVATAEGLYVVTEGDQLQISDNDIIPYEQICAMADYGDNRLLIATSFDGLYIFEKGKFRRFENCADQAIKQTQLFSIDVNDEYIACGTVSKGVILISRKEDSYEVIGAINGLQNNTVLSLLFDSNKRLWCGLDNGISCIYTNSPLRHYSSNLGNSFTGYCTLISKKNIYLGTNQGLMYSSTAGINIQQNDLRESTQLVSNSQGQVWSITQIGESIYCGHNRGLFKIDEGSRPLTMQSVYSDDGVWGMTQIDSERYLIGTYEGILLMTHGENEIASISKIDGYNNSAQKITLHKPSQSVFIIDALGLEQVSFDANYTKANSKLLISNNLFEIKVLTIDNKIVIYTPDKIYEVSDQGELQPTLAYNAILGAGNRYLLLEVDSHRNIWYIEEDGKILRRKYDQALECYDDSLEVFYKDRHLFIPRFASIQEIDSIHYAINNIYGFSLINTTSTRHRLKEEEPIIIGIYDTANRDSLLLSEAYGIHHKSLTLPYSQNSIRILFGCNHSIESNLQYSYFMRGSDNTWSEWASKSSKESKMTYNQKEYTNLREGNYQFMLRLRNDHGKIKESQINITVLPPWQRSKAMYILYLLIIIASILYARRRIIHNFTLRRQLHEIQTAREIENHKRAYRSKSIEHENNIIRLENDRLESEIKLKSAELSNLLLNKLEKNDIINDIKNNLEKVRVEIVNDRTDVATKRIVSLNKYLDDKMIDNVDWGAFEQNFNLINNNFAQKIKEQYGWMTVNERKLCIYIKIGLQNKEIAPLLNISVRGVEMLRYRVRKKMGLSRDVNLYDLFQGM